MAVIDERPGTWWGKGSITARDLDALSVHATYETVRSAIQEARDKLRAAKHGEPVQVRTPLPPEHVHALSRWIQTAEKLSDEAKADLQHTLKNLVALGRSPDVFLRAVDKKANKGGRILISHRSLLPAIPTLILDGTGELDPEYPDTIARIDLDPP